MTYVRIRYSKDGGHTFTDWRQIPLGEEGDYMRRVVARRFGSGRHWVFDVSVTDPVPVNLIAASIQMESA